MRSGGDRVHAPHERQKIMQLKSHTFVSSFKSFMSFVFLPLRQANKSSRMTLSPAETPPRTPLKTAGTGISGSAGATVNVCLCGRRSSLGRLVLWAAVPRPAGVLPSRRCVVTSYAFSFTVTMVIDTHSPASVCRTKHRNSQVMQTSDLKTKTFYSPLSNIHLSTTIFFLL